MESLFCLANKLLLRKTIPKVAYPDPVRNGTFQGNTRLVEAGALLCDVRAASYSTARF